MKNKQLFLETLKKHLDINSNNGYGRGPEAVYRFLGAAFDDENNFLGLKCGPAVKATLKELKIKNTYKAIKEFVNA